MKPPKINSLIDGWFDRRIERDSSPALRGQNDKDGEQTPNWRWKRRGFSLIEVLLAVFLIVALTTILFSASGTLFTTRRSRLQSQAAKIASKDIEDLRNKPFASLPATTAGACEIQANMSADVWSDLQTKLKSGCLVRAINQYPTGNTTMKSVTVTVKWNNDSGVQQTLNIDTLIYQTGL